MDIHDFNAFKGCFQQYDQGYDSTRKSHFFFH
jgi:hypothetical protein